MTSKNIEERRVELHELLCSILGSRHVYFQPPESIKMEYPAIRYSRSKIESTKADNSRYLGNVRYSIIFISRTPNNNIVDELESLPYCSHERFYTAENLNHDVFTIFY